MSPLCSRNARSRTPLVGRAQWGTHLGHPRATYTSKLGRMGRTPTLVLCSRSARPQKGLARRPHLDQHGRHSWREEISKLGWIN